MKVIVGLGNPGKEYTYTRHNVGFILLDMIREAWTFEEWKDSKFQWLISEWMHKWEKILLLKPTTYMNLSGDSIASVVNFYKLDPKTDILIISDDIDMEFAKVRYREEWSHGGQNGLKDSILKLGTHEISRIKVGIGRDEHYSMSDWVLSNFTKEEREPLENEVFSIVCQKVWFWLLNQ